MERAMPYTMTGGARLQSVIDAVRYCVRRGVPGAFAECGVWRGGSVLAMILTLQELGRDDRDVYLFDTFEGMTEPTEHDVSPYHPPAPELWDEDPDGPDVAEVLRPEGLQRGGGARDAALDRLSRASGSTSFAGRSRRRSRARRPTASPCCGWTPIGTSPPATSSSISTPGSRTGAS